MPLDQVAADHADHHDVPHRRQRHAPRRLSPRASRRLSAGENPYADSVPKLETPRTILVWSALICVLVTAASLIGLLGSGPYEQETKNWATQARGQDVGNLIAVAALATSGYSYYKGSFRAALVWIGTLLYFLYAYIVYALAVHYNDLFLVYVAVLGVTSYTLMFAVDRLRPYNAEFPGTPVRTFAGYTLATIGALFALLWLSEVVPATISGEVPQSVIDAGLWVNPIHVIDLAVVLPAFVITGYLAVRGDRSGLFFVGPWLVFSTLMGASIVAAMILMSVEGFDNVVPPMVMVSAVVIASSYAAWRYLQHVEDPDVARSTTGS